MNPYLICAAWVASVLGAGYFAYGAGEDSVTAFNDKAEKIVAATLETAQQGAAAAIAANKPKNTTIIQEVRHEIETQVQYRDCRNSSSGMRSINEAITGKRPEPAGGQQLPGTGAAP